ncbi:DeoR/GlpR family DNA-binding transcription regulator [Fictibacillus phosphorivorans]|uniref:DeoR/GlpR family DNA-binding transcription regulator n=1 Tax=Fictibacillus phosphorivorans TaxID=1221500 RepID=UPI0020425581|nr:DeoR/GlpR family DNA-binding transcription regulator [Fictibacillus phosphorivorans]MCM3717699.1 DeoR/GlpR family DNA-binding transcription regulator [Fictibacillus phosphorivorans]MCM3775599.1 DeoR/GlpR family DNA-binding transcription regulator [Fictibacillus phosphorivorans]
MKVKRITRIEEYLKDKHEASLEELKEHFNVSLNTIRRDINELAKSSTIKKVYGGVVYNKNNHATRDYEDRNISLLNEKKEIGQHCGQYIQEHDIVYLDSGTTTHFVLDQLDEEIEFTLITNSLEVINKAVKFPHVNLITIGETYKRSTKSFIGISDDLTISKFNINKAFMAATAFSLDNGATNSDLFENRIKKLVCKRAQNVYLLIDYTKFGKTSLYTYCDLENLHTIVTNAALDETYVSAIKESGTNIVLL